MGKNAILALSLKFFDNNKQGNEINAFTGYSPAADIAVQLELGGMRGALKTGMKMQVVEVNRSLYHQEQAALVISYLFQIVIQKEQEKNDLSLSEEAKGCTFVSRKMEAVEKVEEISRSVNILKAIDLG